MPLDSLFRPVRLSASCRITFRLAVVKLVLSILFSSWASRHSGRASSFIFLFGISHSAFASASPVLPFVAISSSICASSFLNSSLAPAMSNSPSFDGSLGGFQAA